MIEKLEDTYSMTFLQDGDLIAKSWSPNERFLVDKINELIDEINKLKENK